MKRNKVKGLLGEYGIKQKEIAEALKVSKATVSNVINGSRESRRVKQYVANLLKRDYAKLWGKPA